MTNLFYFLHFSPQSLHVILHSIRAVPLHLFGYSIEIRKSKKPQNNIPAGATNRSRWYASFVSQSATNWEIRISVAHSLMLRCRGFSRASCESLFRPAAFPSGGGRALFRARAQRLGKSLPGAFVLRQRVDTRRLSVFRVAV